MKKFIKFISLLTIINCLFFSLNAQQATISQINSWVLSPIDTLTIRSVNLKSIQLKNSSDTIVLTPVYKSPILNSTDSNYYFTISTVNQNKSSAVYELLTIDNSNNVVQNNSSIQLVKVLFQNYLTQSINVFGNIADNNYGNIIPTLTNIIEVSAGAYHNLFLLNNGQVYHKQGAINAVITDSAVAIYAGNNFSVILLTNGKFKIFGLNITSLSNVPNNLSGKIVQMALGQTHIAALNSNNQLFVWGNNLNNKTTIPAQIMNNVQKIVAGSFHTISLLNNGSIITWGNNDYNQLDSSGLPQNTLNSTYKIIDVAAGLYSSIYLRSDSTLIFKGNLAYGDVRFNANTYNSLPNKITKIFAKGTNVFAIDVNNRLFSWGDPSYDKLNAPTANSNVVSVAPGYYQNLTTNSFNISVLLDTTKATYSFSNKYLTRGANIQLFIRPKSASYKIKELKINGILSDSTNTYTFNNLFSNQLVEANIESIYSPYIRSTSKAVVKAGDTLNVYGKNISNINTQQGNLLIYERLPIFQKFANDIDSTYRVIIPAGKEEKVYAIYGENMIDGINEKSAKWLFRYTGINTDSVVPYIWSFSASKFDSTYIKYFPNNINNVIDVKLGIGRAIVLLNNGTIATFPIQNTSDNQSQWANWALSQSNVVRISMSSTAGYGATGAVPTAYVLKSDGSIAGFGSDVNTEISGQPENLNNVIDISSGTYHTIALLNDGRVKAWGLNKYPNYFTKNELNNIVSISAGRGVGQYFATDNSGNLNLLNIDSDTISNITNTADLTKIGYYSNTLKILDTAPLILDTLIPTKVKFANGFDGFSVFVSDSNNKLSAIGKFPQDLGFQTKTVQEQINQIPDSLITNIDHITLNSNFVFTQTKQSIRYIRRELTINEINNPQNTYLISEPKIFQNKSLDNVNQVSVSETNGILLGKLRVIIKGDSQQTFIPNTVYLKRGDSYTVRFYPKTNFIIDSIFINGKYDTNKLSYTFNNIQTIQFVEIKTRPTIIYISNINQLDSLANGNYQNDYPLNANYILTRNLNFNDTNSYRNVSIKARLTSGIGGWKPIGSAAFPFRGIFNGNGFTITNFYINNTNSYNGFFGYVLNGRIQNLNLISNIINCGNASGILAGTTINTWVDNSSTKGILTSSGNNIGGIIGDAQNSKITNSYSTAYIRSVTQNIGNYGILIGLMNGGIVSNCYTRGTVSIPNLNGQIQSGFIAQTTGAAVKIYNSYSRSQMFTTQYGSIIGSSNNALDSIFYCYSSLLQSLITGQAKQFRSLVYYKTNLPDSILAPSNAYQLQSLYYPRLYKLNSQELLDGQNQDNLKPSNLHYKNDTISLGISVAGRFEKTSFFVGDAPLIKFSIAASNIPLDQISIDSIIGGLTIKNRIASGKYSIVVKAANVFGETLDTLTVFITPVIEISSINQLDSIGKFSKYSTNGNYILTRNLDFRNDSSYSDTTGFKARLTSGNGFSGIENFSGSFNGSNFIIRNLFQRNRTNGGFFNSTSNALIQNLGLLDVSLDNRLGAVGALVGVNSVFALLGAVTKINNCYATGIVYGEAFGVGGLIGLNNDSFEITNSYFKGQVTGNYGVGGFIGVDFGRGSRVSNCYSYGKLLVRTNPAFYSGSGGFVSRIIGNATYNNCYANVSVNIVNSVNLANIYIGGSFIANFGGGTYKIQLNNCYSVDTKPFYGYLNNGIRNQFSSVIINNSISSTDINQINKTLQSSPYFKLSPNSYPLLYRLDNSNNLTLLGGQDSLSAPADFRYNDSNIINSYQNAAELRYTPILNFGTGVNLKFGFVGAIVQNINLDSTNGAIWWNRNLAAGQYNLQVQVSSSAGTLTTNLTLKIKPVINIEFLDQLNLIGVSPSYPANASYRLTRNLNFDSASHYYNSPIITNFNPIGSANVPFIGYFDGSNFTITNLRSTTNGLFGFVGSNACFNNIRLINEQISSNTVNGGLIGNLISGSFGLIINNCYTTGNITNTNSTSGYSGGLVGGGAANALVIRNSFSLMNINGNGSGLIGRASRRVIILNSYYRGIITLTNNSSVYCGGLMGFNTGLAYIRNSYAQAQFKLSNSANVYGGLLGYSNDGYLEYCYATPNILNQPLIANISETDIVYYSTNNYINPSQLNYSNQYQFIGSALPFVFYQNTSKLLDSQVNQQTFVVVLQNYDGQIALREQVIAGENFTARYSAPLGYVIDSVWLNGRIIDSIYGRYTITNINQNYVFVVKYKIATSRFIIYKTEGGSVYINNRQLINNLDTTLIAYRFSSSIFIEADSNYIIDTIWLNGNLYNNLATSISNKISFLSFSNIISDNFVKISFRKINPPLKPIIDTIIGGKNSVVVAFRSPIPVSGSETILYRITAYPTKTTVYSRNSPSLILGLPNNTPLRFTVTAINISGETVSDTSQVITLSDSNYFINTYTLNAGGTISPSISAVLGSTKTIRFNADNNYLIDSVVVDGRGVSGYKGLDSGVYTFNNINTNHFVQVIFRKISYRISVQTNSGGALLVNGRYIRLAGSVSIFKGDSTNVTIIPNFGTSIDSIFVNNTLVSDAQIQTDDQGLDYFILSNINANQFVRVVFKLNTFNINIATNNNILCYVNPQGQVLVLKGQRLVVNYVAYFGNVIDSVIVNGVAVSTNRTGQNLYAGFYLFDNISGDSNIRIVFKQLYFNVRITSNNSSGGIVTPQGRVILQRGDSIRVYVFAAARFVIDSIIINGNAIAITPNSKTYQYLFKNIN
ncbi:MAG: hypothetical protein ORN85_10390, partial [Sediminibacterium sp.]|nr:hypothetical protein [Sediminibacterium sp.]